MVGSSGLEPPTSRLSGARSNQLSYEPISLEGLLSFDCGLFPLVEMMGFEPMTPCLQGRCSPNWATPPLVCVCPLYFKDQKNLIILQNWTTNDAVLESRRPWLKFYTRICTVLILTAENFEEILVVTNAAAFVQFSIERRWSSRTFRYGYLVTT